MAFVVDKRATEMTIDGLGQSAAYNPYSGLNQTGQQPTASNAIADSANRTPNNVISDTDGVISSKMMQLALIYEMVAEAEGSEERGSNMFLQMLLQNILFGSEGSTPLSPTEQAEMLNEIITSGQPGSVQRAMGKYTGGGAQGATYGASGALPAGGTIGGMVSITV